MPVNRLGGYVKDAQGNLVLGRTRWWRFAAVALPAAVLGAGLMAGIANGKVPVAVNVSGQTFKVSANSLDGGRFSQYGGVVLKKGADPSCPVPTRNGCIPVIATVIDRATLKNLCQSVKTGPFSIVIRAGQGDKSVTAHNLLIGLDRLSGDATFTNIDIGQDASTVRTWDRWPAGGFAQEADRVVITNLKQRAYSTHAGTFTLNGLTLRLGLSGEECFADPDLS